MRAPARRHLAPLVLAGMTLAVPVRAQRVTPSYTFSEAARAHAAYPAARPRGAAPSGPSLPVMIFRSSAVALASGSAGALVGMAVDNRRCERHAARDPEWRKGGWFGPCFFETGAATAAGFIGGSVTGAAVVASQDARRRGCPARAARLRAIAGAALGAVPGVIAVATGDDDFPPSRSALIFSAPLVSGAGAAYLAYRCAPPAAVDR